MLPVSSSRGVSCNEWMICIRDKGHSLLVFEE